MKRLLFVFLLLFLHFSAVAEDSQPRVGVITALTGGMATIGTAVKDGIEMARAEHPEILKDITFSYEDDQFDAKQSISAYRKLRTNHGPDLILGFGTVLAQAIGPLVERDKIPFINFNFEAAPVVGKQFIVRAMNHTDQYMAALGEYLKQNSDSDLPIVQTEATFFNAMVGSLQKALGSNHSIIRLATVNPTETNFRSIIAKLRPYQKNGDGHLYSKR